MVTLRSIHDPSIAPLAAASGALRVAWRCWVSFLLTPNYIYNPFNYRYSLTIKNYKYYDKTFTINHAIPARNDLHGGGYSLPKSVVYTFAKEPTLVSGKNIVSKWDNTTGGNTDNNGRGYGRSEPNNHVVKATLSTDSKVRVTSIVINTNATNTATVAITVGNNAIAAQTIQKSGTKGGTNKNYTYMNTSKEESTDIKFTLISDKSVWIKTITINYEESDGRTPTTVKFTGLTGGGVNLFKGKLDDGKDFNGYTAKEANDVPCTIIYAASGDGVATVDATTGAVTVKPNVYGTTTITATFTPKDTEKYAASSSSYTVTNKKPVGDNVFYESFDFYAKFQSGNDNKFNVGRGTLNEKDCDEKGWCSPLEMPQNSA